MCGTLCDECGTLCDEQPYIYRKTLGGVCARSARDKSWPSQQRQWCPGPRGRLRSSGPIMPEQRSAGSPL